MGRFWIRILGKDMNQGRKCSFYFFWVLYIRGKAVCVFLFIVAFVLCLVPANHSVELLEVEVRLFFWDNVSGGDNVCWNLVRENILKRPEDASHVIRFNWASNSKLYVTFPYDSLFFLFFFFLNPRAPRSILFSLFTFFQGDIWFAYSVLAVPEELDSEEANKTPFSSKASQFNFRFSIFIL